MNNKPTAYRSLRLAILLRWIVLCCSCVLYFGEAVAQTESLLLMQDSTKSWHSMMIVRSDNVIGSNSIDLGFIKESVLGGRLEQLQIDRQLDRMKATNRLGGHSFSTLKFLTFNDSLFGKPQWGLQTGISTNYVASAYFKKDLFSLIYNGNAYSDSLAIGPAKGQFQAYQKFSVGLFNKKNWNAISLGLVVGQSMRDLSLYSANVLNTTLGDTVTANYNGTYMRSDTLAKGMANGSGLGLAIDVNYQLPLANGKGLISISLSDVGFIAWNKNTEIYSLKGESKWSGLEISTSSGLQLDSIALPKFKDSLENTYSKKSVIKPLPARLHFRYLHELNNRSFYEFGIHLMPGTAALPRVYMGLGQRPFASLLFTQGISYGGFGHWGLGAGLQYLPNQSWFFSLQTQHLGGFTMSSARSRHIYFSIAKIF